MAWSSSLRISTIYVVLLQETHWKQPQVSAAPVRCASIAQDMIIPLVGEIQWTARACIQAILQGSLSAGALSGTIAPVAGRPDTDKPANHDIEVYQHVWRTHLPTTENHHLGGPDWRTREQACVKVPSRHHLVVAGDFNCTLKPQNPCISNAATPSDAVNHSRELPRPMCPKHFSLQAQACLLRRTQIDFVLIRRPGEQRFILGPCAAFQWAPVVKLGMYRCMQSYRPCLSVGCHSHRKSHFPQCDMTSLQQAVQQQTAQAQSLLSDVQQQCLTCANCASESTASCSVPLWNTFLQQLPKTAASAPNTVHQPDKPGSSPSYAMPGPRSLGRLLQQWRQVVLFRRASLALRQQTFIRDKSWRHRGRTPEAIREPCLRSLSDSAHVLVGVPHGCLWTKAFP